jgi:hypothetical protein
VRHAQNMEDKAKNAKKADYLIKVMKLINAKAQHEIAKFKFKQGEHVLSGKSSFRKSSELTPFIISFERYVRGLHGLPWIPKGL